MSAIHDARTLSAIREALERIDEAVQNTSSAPALEQLRAARRRLVAAEASVVGALSKTDPVPVIGGPVRAFNPVLPSRLRMRR